MIPAYDRTMVRRIFNQLHTDQSKFQFVMTLIEKSVVCQNFVIPAYTRTTVIRNKLRWYRFKHAIATYSTKIQIRIYSIWYFPKSFLLWIYYGRRWIFFDKNGLCKLFHHFFFFPNKSQLTLEINWATTYLFTYVNMQGRKKWVGAIAH